jgi:dihydroorotate dehydrogenase electron transfer subunit
VIRLQAPKCAAAATPGSFAHLTCDPSADAPAAVDHARRSGRRLDRNSLQDRGPRARGAVEAARRRAISVLGPIGHGFKPSPARPRTLLVGGGVGIPPMVFLAESLKGRTDASWKPLVLMGSEIPFPFRARPSTMLVPGVPAGAIACMPLLEDWGVPSRLATLAGFPGCFDGYVTDLAAAWLSSLDAAALGEVELFACGPTPMLQATGRVARRFGVPCQVSLEEFMACAVGGCAGCAVPVVTRVGACDEAGLRRRAGVRRQCGVSARGLTAADGSDRPPGCENATGRLTPWQYAPAGAAWGATATRVDQYACNNYQNWGASI